MNKRVSPKQRTTIYRKQQLEQLIKSAEAQVQEKLQIDLALAQMQAQADIDMKKAKTKSEIWQSFLARESIASIVGGLLLILSIAAVFIAMLLKLTLPDIITNSFYVILGYFFGQATSSPFSRARAKNGAGSSGDANSDVSVDSGQG